MNIFGPVVFYLAVYKDQYFEASKNTMALI